MALDTREVVAARHSPMGLASVDTATGEGSALHLPEHLRTLNRALVELDKTDKKGLIVTLAPRHGKSLACSTYFPAWYAAQRPEAHIVIASAELSLATQFTRAAREVVERRADLLAVELDPDLRGSTHWRCRRIGAERFEGSVKAVGVGGALTGRSASLLILDDLIKSSAEAHSTVKRERLWNWYQSVATTRLEPRGKVLLVGTRWADGDLIGRLLDEEPERWDVLGWPAVSEEGEALWPQRYPKEALERKRAEVGSYHWESMYLGHPPSDHKGGAFDTSRIDLIDDLGGLTPLRVVAGLDFAATEAAGDYSAVAVVAQVPVRDEDGRHRKRLVVLEVARAQVADPFEWAAGILRRHQRNLTVLVERRSRSADGKIPLNMLRKYLRGHTVNIRGVAPGAGKEFRAIPTVAVVERGDLVLVRGAWNESLLAEMSSFPNGDHDDQVDALAYAVRELESPRGLVASG